MPKPGRPTMPRRRGLDSVFNNSLFKNSLTMPSDYAQAEGPPPPSRWRARLQEAQQLMARHAYVPAVHAAPPLGLQLQLYVVFGAAALSHELGQAAVTALRPCALHFALCALP